MEIIPKSNGARWESWIRTFLSFIVGAMSSAFLIGGKSRDLSDLIAYKGECISEFKQIDERFKDMDKNGTNKSHWVDDTQEGEITQNRLRLIEVEHKIDQVNVMQGKIERLEGELKSFEDRRK